MRKSAFTLVEKILIMAGMILLAILVLFLFTGALTMIHSDGVALVNNALEIVRTKEIFPDQWVGATMIFWFQYAIAFFLLFVQNYLLAKTFAQVIWLTILLGSVIFVSRKVLKNNSWIVAVPILFTCWSVNLHYDMLFIQCPYTSILFMTLYSVGTFIWAVTNLEIWQVQKKRLCIAMILVMVTCIHGIVLIQSLLIPLLGTVVILYIQQYQKEKLTLHMSCWKNVTAVELLVIVSGVVGYLISEKVSELSGVVGNGGVTNLAQSIPQITEHVKYMWEAIFCYAGFTGAIPLFSLNGIVTIIRIAAFVAITFVFPLLAYRDYKNQSKNVQFFLIFVIIHVIEVVFILLLTSIEDYSGAARYLLTSIMLLQLIGANYIYTRYLKSNLLGILYSVGISVISLMLMLPTIQMSLGYADSFAQMKGLTSFLSENGLCYGYATFWNAGNNTILSNGEVQIRGVTLDTNKIAPYYWLTSKAWYNPNYYTGESFLLLSNEELDTYAPSGYEDTALGIPNDILRYANYVILVYDYNISENNFMGILDGSRNYLNSMELSDLAMRQDDGSILIGSEQVMYGPYWSLPAGKYRLTVDAQFEGEHSIQVTSGAGAEVLLTQTLKAGETEVQFGLEEYTEGIEFVVYGSDNRIKITAIYLQSIDA